ncbi:MULTISPECIES: DUF1120 domain-containing protein [Pseudomonas]|uniref:DUF1120 domain-containing protein n=1 Tax=Pseudomonas TaxID=286 RepID=UPI00235F6134|nr:MULTISPECIES: DUF1120 domain-containing protein [Pseudomonas]WJV25606.1 DUF1120 domain-containing protein [Pseudomonas chlororaphis]
MNLKPLLALALLASAMKVASAADLSVSGQIKPASACNLTLSDRGQIDLGELSRNDLHATDETFFVRKLQLLVECKAATKVGVKSIDNRESVYGDFGLGIQGSSGRFAIYPFHRFGDGKPLFQLKSWDGISWRHNGSTVAADPIYPSELGAWAEEGALPQAFTTVSTELQLTIHLPPLSDLDLSQQIDLDGSATMELVYL